MKKITPNGAVIKKIREQLERLSTQKEFAHEIGVSERTLRQIENRNLPVSIITIDRMAKALNVHRRELGSALDSPKIVPNDDSDPLGLIALWNNEQLVPRYDYDIASTTMDEGHLFKEASTSHDVVAIIETTLSEETGAYAKELIDILTSLSWSKRLIRALEGVSALDEIAVRLRIRQLLVLLKGNDVWVYETKLFRRLPECHTVAPKDEPHRLESRTTVALGPPGEYGETTMRVPIDHGRPFILPAWNLDQTKTG